MRKRIAILLIVILIISTVIFGCSYTPVNVEEYVYKPSEKSQFYSSDEELIGEAFNQNRTYVKLEDMPENLVNGIVAVEDARFYKHKGYDPIGILRAFFTNIKNGDISEGASTITQQLARNLFEQITTDQTLIRKINEALTARQLEKKYSKDQILEMYLNEIYLGSGTYGVQEASKEYFGKDVAELSLAECAMLAGLPQAPSAYAPDEHFELAKKRQEIVLNRMVTGEYITKEQAEEAKKEEVKIIDEATKKLQSKKDEYSAFINKVRIEYQKYLQSKYPNQEITKEKAIDLLQTEGLKIYTTVNSKMQDLALTSLNQGLTSHGLQDDATGSFVSIDSTTGAVLAYYGGNTEIDMATKPRQPGSTIKPFVYAKAFEDEIVNANSLILDTKTTFDGNYTPKNADGSFRGYLTVREAIVDSVNVPAVKVMDTLGVNNSVDFLKEFGISTAAKEDYGLATALGGMTHGISPLEMAKAYGVFANEGVSNDVYFIEKIVDRDDNIIFTHESSGENTKQVVSPNTANQMKDVLTDVVNRGTATRARSSYVTAGKTGTSNENKDLWFVGFTGKITSSLWIGNLENKSISGRSSYAAQIYGNYLSKLVQNKLIESNQLEKISTYDDTISISILSPNHSYSNLSSITSEDVITIIIPKDQEFYYNDSRVVEVQIDKESGKIFVEGTCPEKNRVNAYYLVGQEQVDICDENHFFNKIEDFFNNIDTKNSEKNNEKNNEKNENTVY